MNWLRRALGDDDPAPPAASQPADDSPEALHSSLADVVRDVNSSAGGLPAAAMVAIRQLTDTLDDVIDTSQGRPLDVYAAIMVRSTLDDYLPTTVRHYLAVPEDLRTRPRPDGHSPQQSLYEQIAAIQTSASQVLVAAQGSDVDALMTQGAFLRTKFSGSDLDL